MNRDQFQLAKFSDLLEQKSTTPEAFRRDSFFIPP